MEEHIAAHYVKGQFEKSKHLVYFTFLQVTAAIKLAYTLVHCLYWCQKKVCALVLALDLLTLVSPSTVLTSIISVVAR